MGRILELLLEKALGKLPSLLAAVQGVHLLIRADAAWGHLIGHLVPRRHHVIVVHILHKGLHLGALGDLFLGHLPGDLQGSSVDAGHHAVPEGPSLGAIVVGLHHDGLLARIASLEHDDHASCFDKLAHLHRPAKVFTTLPQTLEPKPWTDDDLR